MNQAHSNLNAVKVLLKKSITFVALAAFFILHLIVSISGKFGDIVFFPVLDCLWMHLFSNSEHLKTFIQAMGNQKLAGFPVLDSCIRMLWNAFYQWLVFTTRLHPSRIIRIVYLRYTGNCNILFAIVHSSGRCGYKIYSKSD